MGDNTRVDKSSPIQTVAGGTNWKLVGGGRYHVIAIKTDGTLWGWGQNHLGQLGTNTLATIVNSPVQTVAGGNNWKQVSCGQHTTSAIKTDGTLWTWGTNNNGALGGTSPTAVSGNRSSPVQVGTGYYNDAKAGLNHTVGLADNNTLYVWGDDNFGQ